MPGHFESVPTSPLRIVLSSTASESLLMIVSALFGPMPVTCSIIRRKKSRSAAVAKP